MVGLKARIREWLIALVREAVKAELLAVTARTFIPVEVLPAVASKPAATAVRSDSFESLQDEAIKQCEVSE